MSKRDISSVLDVDAGRPTTKPRLDYKSDTDDQPSSSESTLHPQHVVQRLSFPALSSSHPPKAVPFQQPTPIISFSYTPTHEFEFTNSAMRYYSEPPIGAQLGYGYERWIRRPEEKGRLDSLLRAIARVKDEKRVALEDVGVVCWRGVMTRLLTAPYEERDSFCMNVMLVSGTLYFEEHLTESKLADKNNVEPRLRKMMYYGYAFESYGTSDSPPLKGQSHDVTPSHRHDPPGWGGDVNTNSQWCSVVRTKLGDTRLIIGGEVDCVRERYSGTTDSFVELKTSLTIRGARDEARFEKKLLKFYFQSFLLGVPEIIVGFRTPSGQLTATQAFKTIHIPRMVRGKPGAWDPAVCLDWGVRFLSFLKHTIRETDPSDDTVWRVEFVPNEGVSVQRLDVDGVDEVSGGEERNGFLPRWYWDRK